MVKDSFDSIFSLDEVRAINQIISNMYNRIADSEFSCSLPDFSTSFLHDVADQISFDKGNIMFYTFNPQISAYEVTSFYHIGWNENDLENYISHYCHIDDVLHILSGEREIAFLNGNIFSFREKTQYYQEFVKPAQIINSIDANIPLPKTRDMNAIIGLFRDEKKKDFTSKDLEIIKSFQPHLSNALSHYSEFNSNAKDNLMEIFSNIESICVCVLNDNLKLVTYNSAFQVNTRAMGFSSLVDNEMFGKIQNLCSKIKKEHFDKDYHKSGRISIEINGQTYPVEIVSIKLEDNSNKFICLLLTDNFAFKIKKLHDFYKLSKRECEIVNLILKHGLTNEEISKTLFISTSTVKKHLTSAYQKIGVQNQKQLQTLFRKI